jgi:hypothetical protein|tara:strand:- start:1915 stop:2094 length:180 start_codon:yes stop_codon:yes gene_type:complete
MGNDITGWENQDIREVMELDEGRSGGKSIKGRNLDWYDKAQDSDSNGYWGNTVRAYEDL